MGEVGNKVRVFFSGEDIVELNSVIGGGGNELISGVEGKLVNIASSIEVSDRGVKVKEIPDINVLILSSGSNISSVRGDSNMVDSSFMSLERVSDLEVSVPDLEFSIPSNRGEIRLNVILGRSRSQRRISKARNPIGVIVGVRVEFAFSKSIPKLDALVSSSRDNLSVISRERNGENFLLVSDERSDSLLGSKIPKSDGLIPRGGKKIAVILREGEIGDKVVVSGHRLVRISSDLGGFSLINIVKELPDDEGLVTGSRNKKVGVRVTLGGTSNKRGDHSVVSFELSTIENFTSFIFRVHFFLRGL